MKTSALKSFVVAFSLTRYRMILSTIIVPTPCTDTTPAAQALEESAPELVAKCQREEDKLMSAFCLSRTIRGRI